MNSDVRMMVGEDGVRGALDSDGERREGLGAER